MNKIFASLQDHITVMTQLKDLVPLMEAATHSVLGALSQKKKVFLMGNGGSASDAQHLAAELVGRFKVNRRALPAIALATDTSILTALSNDYDYSIIFSRQLEALCEPGDVVIGITTSGTSKNVIKGIETAKQLGAYTIGFTGQSGGKIAGLADLCFCVPSQNVARIQEAHIFIGHMLCELIENKIAESEGIELAEMA